MGLAKALSLFVSILVFVAACLINTDFFNDCLLPEFPNVDFNKKWNQADSLDNEEIKRVTIKISEVFLNATRDKIKARILPPSMPQSNFRYGFNSDYLKVILKHWTENYEWRKWEEKINSFPHYFTTISGLQMHFIHIKPKLKTGQRSIPILLLHGWPGSFFEFYKVIPQLVETPGDEGVAFEVICPSLPGFGWSDAPQMPGHGIAAISAIMFKLMERLNITEKFFIQGGDFGAIIAGSMAKINPEKVAGIHTNMVHLPTNDIRYWLRVAVGSILPTGLHFLPEEDQKMVYPFIKKVESLMNQMGYFWLQVTRPNTIGIALHDNPVGLAAYILEKFGSWSNYLEPHLNSPSGGIEDIKISKDEMLTNVMIYHATASISTSVRLYKEMWNEVDRVIMLHPVRVPTGVAIFPKDLICVPKEFAKYSYRDIRQFTRMPRGGHFAALEEPSLLSDDIRSFVNEVVFHTTL